MRLTVIGHSCLYLETSAGTVLVDPWLSGSCYWRSWWLYPPSTSLPDGLLAPDHLYVTHHHFDHLHYPSMRRLDRSTHVMVPEFGVDTMTGEVRSLGFEHVEELPHGEIVTLGPGVKVASYQHGFDDTVFVVAADGEVIVDVNDCKIRGRALERVHRDFGRPTFVMKGWSWAQGYPICYTADDPADLALVTADTYAEDFIAVVRALRPRYAVPFGSMVAFLHPETRDLNRRLIPPAEMVARLDAALAGEPAGAPATTGVVMLPGDSWTPDGGFVLSTEDWYGDRERRLAGLADALADRFEAQAEVESRTPLEFEAFEAFFLEFVRSLPPGTTRAVLRRPVVFEVSSDPRPFWVVDAAARRVYRATEEPSDAASIVRVAEGMLADAIAKRLVHVVQGSMRIRVHVRRGGIHDDLAFWGLINVWEIGYLPLPRDLTRRFARVAWRRRLEAVDMLGALRGRGSALERLSSNFATRRDEARAR